MLSAVAPGVTTDPYGNPVTPVLEIQGADGVVSITAPALIRFPSLASFENAIATIASGIVGTSPQFIQLLLASATTTLAGARDQVQIELNSAASDGSSDANGELLWVGSNGTPHEYAYWDSTGFNIVAGLATAAHPGSSPAVAETRQSVAAGGTPAWSGTIFYELTATGRLEIVAQLTAPSSTPINNNTICTLPPGTGRRVRVSSSGSRPARAPTRPPPSALTAPCTPTVSPAPAARCGSARFRSPWTYDSFGAWASTIGARIFFGMTST